MTTWPSLLDTTGIAADQPIADLLAWIRQPKIATDKTSLPGFSLARFQNNHRALADVIDVSAVVLDDDASGLTVEDIAAGLADVAAGVVYSTHSSTPGAPRTRTILFVSRPMTAAEHSRVWTHVAALVKTRGLIADEQAKDASRLWFVPAIQPEATFYYAEFGAEPLDVDAILTLAPACEGEKALIVADDADDVTDADELAYRRDLYTAYLKTTPLIRCPQNRGHGDTNLFTVVQYGAYDLQLPTEDVLELVRAHYDPRNDRQWGDELEERVAHKSKTAKTGSTRPRLEPPPRELAHIFANTPTASEPTKEDVVRAPTSTDGPLVVSWGAWHIVPPRPTYLVEGLIPAATVGMFVAQGSSLKTWTALDVGRAIASGEAWLGRFPTKKGRVVILDFESGEYELHRRMYLLNGGQEIDGLGASCYPNARIDDEAVWKQLATMKDLALVIVDSLAAGAPGVDENDTRVSTPLKMAARFTEATGASVLFIHHSRKDDGDDRKMVRGSTAIYADCDWAFRFNDVSETESARQMRMTCIKPCMGAKPAPIPIELTDEHGLRYVDDKPEPVKSVADSERDVQAAILLALEARGFIATKRKIREAVNMGTNRVDPELDVLLKQGRVVHIEGQGYALDDDSKRRARVIEAASKTFFASAAQLGSASFTSTRFVEELIRLGVVGRSAEGRLLVSSN